MFSDYVVKGKNTKRYLMRMVVAFTDKWKKEGADFLGVGGGKGMIYLVLIFFTLLLL